MVDNIFPHWMLPAYFSIMPKLSEVLTHLSRKFVFLIKKVCSKPLAFNNTSDSLRSDSTIITEVCEGLAGFYGTEVEF